MAILEDHQVLRQSELPVQLGTVQGLAPTIAAQLPAAGWHPADIQLVAVSQGPGSFTGLRIGVTTAKTLAYAIGVEVIGVPTLQVIAAQVPYREIAAGQGQVVSAVLDAQRRQLYAALFRQCRSGPPEPLGEVQVLDYSQWIATLQPGTVVSGPGLSRVSDLLPPPGDSQILVADPQYWPPRAATVGQIGYRHYQAGRRDDLWTLAPRYYRRSAAEEKLDERQQPGAAPDNGSGTNQEQAN